MNYQIAIHTDVGIKKETNQDSLLVKQAETEKGNIILAVVCDGMGGLEKGEVASATVINAFSLWFKNELPTILSKNSYYEDVKYRWDRIIKEQNQNIGEYGRKNHIQLGTTISALLIFEDGIFLIGHVGDSRIYKITDNEINVLTLDQTLVAQKVRNGTMTKEEAERDPRRSMLLQCVGASKTVEPDYIEGVIDQNECYMLCSDGFRHVVSAEEIRSAFAPSVNSTEDIMKSNIIKLVELNKERNETDNITAILLKTI